MRLDVYLFENGLAESRTDAKKLITEGCVFVDDKPVTKPAFEVEEHSVRVSSDENRYVSRGGYKLEGALNQFHIEPKDKSCIDIGASSGGFTDCLLKRGASRVVCVDSGTNQLKQSLRDDQRVTVMENVNARYLNTDMLPYCPNLCVMDVSFISATYIIGAIYQILEVGGEFVCLIKPQFEVGKSNIGKGGIVKDEKVRRSAIEKVVNCAESVGFINKGVIQSPIKGGDGNVEYLAYFIK